MTMPESNALEVLEAQPLIPDAVKCSEALRHISAKLMQSQDNDIIVLHADMEELDYDICSDAFTVVRRAFPNNRVLMLPKEITLNLFTKEQIQEIVDNLNKFLDELN